MAKQRMITRTIQTTTATLLCVDTTNGTTHEETIVLPTVFKTDKNILKVAEKMLDPTTSKPVHVVAANVNEDLYGMTEEKFLELATVLPNRKPVDAAPADATEE